MEPVACTLTTKQLAERTVEWTDLQRHALSVAPLDTGAALMLPGSMAAEVEALAAAECQCCTFLTITFERLDGLVRLEITSTNPEGQPIAKAIAGLTTA